MKKETEEDLVKKAWMEKKKDLKNTEPGWDTQYESEKQAAASAASSHQCDRFMSDSSQSPAAVRPLLYFIMKVLCVEK